MGHIPTKLHRFPTSSFWDFMWTDTQKQPKTIPACSMHTGNNFSLQSPHIPKQIWRHEQLLQENQLTYTTQKKPNWTKLHLMTSVQKMDWSQSTLATDIEHAHHTWGAHSTVNIKLCIKCHLLLKHLNALYSTSATTTDNSVNDCVLTIKVIMSKTIHRQQTIKSN